MMTVLLDNQIKANDKLKTKKVGALFMEAGTGKTRAAMELIKTIESDYILWLTPFQTKQNLRDEINVHGGLECDIIGIETLSSSDRCYLELRLKIQQSNTPVIVCDESLKIKNFDAIRTQRIIDLGSLAEYKLILNGTPLSRNLLDIWAQMEFLSPKILKMGIAEYKNTFCEYTTMTKQHNGRTITKEWINKYHNVDYLFKLIEPYVFECDLKLDLNKQYINIDYQITEKEEEEHQELKDKYLNDDYLEKHNNNIFLEITQKMQHNYSCSISKFDIVENIISKYDRSKVLICAKYIDTKERLKKRFTDIKIISWQKHSFGLNLQDYNVMIKFDKHWDYALHEQLEHRIYRTGQQNECFIYDFTANTGLDDLINKNVMKKSNLLDYFKNKSIKELHEKL